MRIEYLGPGDAVNVGGHGPHRRGEIKDYPDDVGAELLATSKKQRFAAVEDPPPAPDPAPATVFEPEPEPAGKKTKPKRK
jgi:hypothetical protein